MPWEQLAFWMTVVFFPIILAAVIIKVTEDA